MRPQHEQQSRTHHRSTRALKDAVHTAPLQPHHAHHRITALLRCKTAHEYLHRQRRDIAQPA